MHQNLDLFINNLNNHHQSIQFTMESSEYELPLLDTFIYKEGNQLKTRVYHKPTDNKQYLLYTSYHPKQYKDAIPYGLLVHAGRICPKRRISLQKLRTSSRPLEPENILNKILNHQLGEY